MRDRHAPLAAAAITAGMALGVLAAPTVIAHAAVPAEWFCDDCNDGQGQWLPGPPSRYAVPFTGPTLPAPDPRGTDHVGAPAGYEPARCHTFWHCHIKRLEHGRI